MKSISTVIAVFLGALTALSLNACSTTSFYASNTGAQIGCPEQEVQVGEIHSSIRTQSWEASCRGKKFYCNSTSSMGMGSNQINCKQSLE